MNATRFSILGALAASLLLMPACDDKKGDAKSDAKAEGKADEGKKDDAKAADDAKEEAPKEAEEAAEEAEDGASGADGAGAAAAAPAKVGVAICDEYIEKYGKCIDENAPDNMKTQMKEALAKSAERFKAQSEGPDKDSLEQSCTAALEAVKKTSKGWGCTYE